MCEIRNFCKKKIQNSFFASNNFVSEGRSNTICVFLTCFTHLPTSQTYFGESPNVGLRPLSATRAQSCAIVYFCGLLGPFVRGIFVTK